MKMQNMNSKKVMMGIAGIIMVIAAVLIFKASAYECAQCGKHFLKGYSVAGHYVCNDCIGGVQRQLGNLLSGLR